MTCAIHCSFNRENVVWNVDKITLSLFIQEGFSRVLDLWLDMVNFSIRQLFDVKCSVVDMGGGGYRIDRGQRPNS
jgi:hypothetical protein